MQSAERPLFLDFILMRYSTHQNLAKLCIFSELINIVLQTNKNKRLLDKKTEVINWVQISGKRFWAATKSILSHAKCPRLA